MKPILVVSVHPDDETLGVGGTLLRHKSFDDKIYWLNITGISTEHPYGYDETQVSSKNNEINQVLSLFEFEDVVHLNLPTRLLDTIEYGVIVEKIELTIQKIKPRILYMPNRSDVHTDHKVAFHAVFSGTKNFRNPFIERILMYETMSETEFSPALQENAFIPNVFVDITDFIDQKLRIMSVYQSELMEGNKPRSLNAIKSLAAYRGSRIGADYAEAFMLLFEKS